jgi:hypothetical protein
LDDVPSSDILARRPIPTQVSNDAISSPWRVSGLASATMHEQIIDTSVLASIVPLAGCTTGP